MPAFVGLCSILDLARVRHKRDTVPIHHVVGLARPSGQTIQVSDFGDAVEGGVPAAINGEVNERDGTMARCCCVHTSDYARSMAAYGSRRAASRSRSSRSSSKRAVRGSGSPSRRHAVRTAAAIQSSVSISVMVRINR